MIDGSILNCSRVSLLKISEIGETYYIFDGSKKRALFVRGYNTLRNGIANVSLIISVEGDTLLLLNGRAMYGKVMRTCTSNPQNGSQYVLRINGRVYKLSILEDYRTAVFEEIIIGP
jgi:hypothetical protein